jgi:hypothetical protein
MNTSDTEPGNDQGNKQLKKEQDPENNQPANKSLEHSGPNKDKDYKVLHKDGSLADLPDQNVEGSGALAGTIGLGT